MKKPSSLRKKYRKKFMKVKAEKAKMKRLEKTDFLQWNPTTVNGIKQ